MNDPRSPDEARAHIQTIRQQKGLGEAGEKSSNVADLEAALRMYVYSAPVWRDAQLTNHLPFLACLNSYIRNQLTFSLR